MKKVSIQRCDNVELTRHSIKGTRSAGSATEWRVQAKTCEKFFSTENTQCLMFFTSSRLKVTNLNVSHLVTNSMFLTLFPKHSSGPCWQLKSHVVPFSSHLEKDITKNKKKKKNYTYLMSSANVCIV